MSVQGGEGTADEQHADLPADAASRGELPEGGGEPTPGSDNDGAEAGYSAPGDASQS
ncbi:hypothetical protein [Cellulomonas aerilata]|uniref:Uncharacterized protein n=1 Tax=Cellulomonas aerilata TaxID=515326 RepID=A0A512DBG0_9CELL|nr:hypothetical protein [Cellulomonas aerilata]GEO33580.1 hypothetical protein CAE01nite_13050 [Cellulomonas aerilata]